VQMVCTCKNQIEIQKFWAFIQVHNPLHQK
jgi:hypothetical protein